MKFMLLQFYGGAECPLPMAEWTPEEAQAHTDFQLDLNAELRESGELIEVRALTVPELAKRVVSDGGPPVVTDGPFPESKELLAGYRLVDVESQERAIEIAARGSAAPGPGGTPFGDRIEVREVMWEGEG
jgi:hypothetical protein